MPSIHFRTDRLKILAVVVFLIAALGFYFVIQKAKLGDLRLASDKTLLMGLAVILVVLTVSLAWVLVRNLAGVLAEKREGVMGAHLRARVASAFLFLVMVPCLLLFTGAILILSQTLKSLTPPRVVETIRSAGEIADELRHGAARRASRSLELIAAELPGGLSGTEDERLEALERLRWQHDLAALAYLDPQGRLSCAALTPRRERTAGRGELCSAPPARIEESLLSGRLVIDSSPLSYGWRTLAIQPVDSEEGRHSLLWAVHYIPDEIATRLDGIELTREQVLELRRRSPVVQRLLVALFALLTLLVLFAAVWSGLFMARAITNPLMELVGGTRAIAEGDLSYRVPAEGKDEISQLARSFNHMAEEIQRHRRDLVDRQHYIENLLAAVPVGVISLQMNGQVTTINRAALDVLRVEDMAPGVRFDGAVLKGREAVCSVVEPVLSGHSARVEAEVRIEAKGGSVSIQVVAGHIQVSEGDEGVLVLLEDLTSLRRAERVAAWGEVARRVAHEIKNPLTPIRLAAERLRRRYRKDNVKAAEAIEQGVETIVREVDSLKDLVDEFSRFARLPELRLQPGQLGEVAREALALYQESHPGMRFRDELTEQLPPHRIDAAAMRRCLINLIDNAIAAAGDGGTITVRTSVNEAHRSVAIEIEDDGPGLSEGDREQLFLPTFSRRPGGTGLGLAIVHRIVLEHGGQIRANAGSTRGTRMMIEIPITGQESSNMRDREE